MVKTKGTSSTNDSVTGTGHQAASQTDRQTDTCLCVRTHPHTPAVEGTHRPLNLEVTVSYRIDTFL